MSSHSKHPFGNNSITLPPELIMIMFVSCAPCTNTKMSVQPICNPVKHHLTSLSPVEKLSEINFKVYNQLYLKYLIVAEILTMPKTSNKLDHNFLVHNHNISLVDYLLSQKWLKLCQTGLGFDWVEFGFQGYLFTKC